MRAVPTLSLAFAIAAGALLSPAAAQDVAPTSPDPTAIALARAIDARLTVWRTASGRRVHVDHCRHQRGGCSTRIAAFARLISEVSRAHGVDPFLLAAVAVKESGFNPLAAGSRGERGIVQLHPNGVGYRVRFVRNERYREACGRRPEACQREVLEVGARHLADALARCGNPADALGAYNSGVCQTNGYSHRVLEERDRLVELAKLGDGAPPTPTLVD